MHEKINVLDYKGSIHGIPGSYYVFFGKEHANICKTIFNNILNSNNLDLNWDIILSKLYSDRSGMRYSTLFPEFITVKKLKLFVLALNTRLRIIIR